MPAVGLPMRRRVMPSKGQAPAAGALQQTGPGAPAEAAARPVLLRSFEAQGGAQSLRPNRAVCHSCRGSGICPLCNGAGHEPGKRFCHGCQGTAMCSTCGGDGTVI
jgi:hypothetical protein